MTQRNRSLSPAAAALSCALSLCFSGCAGEASPKGTGPISQEQPSPELPFEWPPALDQAYPALNLMDAEGQRFDFASLRGQVVLVEPIGMT